MTPRAKLAWIAPAVLIAGALFGRPQAGAQVPQPVGEASRRECFELRATQDGAAVGFASLPRMHTPQGVQLEWQIHFPEQELRVWHVETRSDSGARWVWREQQPRRGRTVVAEHAGERVDVTEWGRPIVWRKSLAASGPSCFPLELQELLRRGELAPGDYCWFDPLSNEVESVQLVLQTVASFAPRDEILADDAEPPACEDLRQADLLRVDRSLAASWTFRGDELVSFRWQRGGLNAVRIDAERFEAGIATPASAEAQPAPPPPQR